MMVESQRLLARAVKRVSAAVAISLAAASWHACAMESVDSSAGFFAGVRIGAYEGYNKVAVRNGKEIDGTFKANGFGLQLGYESGPVRGWLEINPGSDAKVAGEVAPVSSTLLLADYSVWKNDNQQVGIGAFLGEAEFELEIGPNGIRFQENPIADGLVYGLMANYRYSLAENWQIGVDVRHALSSYDGSGVGDAGDPIEMEIESYTQLNLNATYRF